MHSCHEVSDPHEITYIISISYYVNMIYTILTNAKKVFIYSLATVLLTLNKQFLLGSLKCEKSTSPVTPLEVLRFQISSFQVDKGQWPGKPLP